jgi:hypothetical protein
MSITNTLTQWITVKRIQKALRRDPYSVELLLELADRLKADPEETRRVLHRILSLEPGNRQAGARLLDLDRAEIGGDTSRLSQAVILTRPSSSDFPAPPLVLRYSFVHQILVYLFILCAVVAGLSTVREPLVLAALSAFLLIPLWFISAVIEIGDAGLRVFRLFGLVRSRILWREIREWRPAFLGHGIRILGRTGKSLEVSSQIHGYPFILDILRQMRPDLFTDIQLSLSTVETAPPIDASVTPAGERLFK